VPRSPLDAGKAVPGSRRGRAQGGAQCASTQQLPEQEDGSHAHAHVPGTGARQGGQRRACSCGKRSRRRRQPGAGGADIAPGASDSTVAAQASAHARHTSCALATSARDRRSATCMAISDSLAFGSSALSWTAQTPTWTAQARAHRGHPGQQELQLGINNLIGCPALLFLQRQDV
jgi:hypothetical protein